MKTKLQVWDIEFSSLDDCKCILVIFNEGSVSGFSIGFVRR